MTRDHRRLAAIVSADVVGYSLLMGRDDSATLVGLKAHRRELIDPKIAEYGGRIVKTTGDGLLLEFPSVVDAVRCAVDIQRGMAERNAGVSSEQRIDFRIGINVGDIIIDGDDIFGDGVNVAARLQTLAEPGGIRASRVVRDQVLDKLSFTFEDLGPQEVKNIARPVEVYRIDLGNAALQALSGGRRRWQRLTKALGWRALGIGIVVLLIGGTTAWYLQSLQMTPRKAGAPIPPAFSIAILPFASSGATAADEVIAKELAPDLAEAFGNANRYAWVISSRLAASYADKVIDPRAVGRELNVRYLVEGQLRRTRDRVVLTATLIDAATATQVWSDKVEITEAKAGVTTMAISPQLISGLRNALNDAETRRVSKQDPAAASAMDLVIRGWAIEQSGYSLDHFLESKKMYDEALRLDPNLVDALVSRAKAGVEIVRTDPRADRDSLLRDADRLTSRAVALGGDDPRVWSARGWVLAWQRRWEESLTAYQESLRITPNRGATINNMAIMLLWSGRAEESLPWIDKALASEGGALFADLLQRKCGAYTMLGRYEEAIAACEKSAGLGGDVFTYIYLTAAYAQQGQHAKAVAAREQVSRLWPNFALARWKLLVASDSPVYWQQAETHLFTGLRKAGVPEN